MIAEVISVGTEILMGQIVNTDAQYLARELSAFGISLYHQSTVGDNKKRLIEAIETAFHRSDIIILSGGLGPTEDDLTKLAVAEFLDVPMITDENSKKYLEAIFAGYHRKMTPNNLRQVEFPLGSIILPNSCGSAPGCICVKDDKSIITLPGPPHELKAMFELSVAPYLRAKSNRQLYSRVLRIFGMGESAVEHEIKDLIDAQVNPTIAPYAALVEVTLRITASCAMDDDPKKLVEPVISEIKRRLGDCVYSDNDEALAHIVARLLREQGKTIAVAESLTGGMIADKLVEIPGISKHFVEGAVLYSNAAKERLGVSSATLCAYSAVSEQTAKEMARCMRLHAGSDIAVSTTGVAGPGADEAGNPEGLIYIGIADETGERAFKLQTGGNRQRTRMYACLSALNRVRIVLESKQLSLPK